MRAVIQRCSSASVSVGGSEISSIGPGLMVLLGIREDDTQVDQDWITKRILAAKLFDAKDGTMWKQSVIDTNQEILCVSQFTLFCELKKGSKPDFRKAMTASQSKIMYESVLQDLRKGHKEDKIKAGQFGAMMAVSLVNDGPTTLILDSRENEKHASASGASTPNPANAKKDAKQLKQEMWQQKVKKNASDSPLADPLADSAVESPALEPPVEGVDQLNLQ